MYSSKALVVFSILAWAEARFGQENPAAIQEIGAVTSGGDPGQAATIAGGAISDLLAAANPCDKLKTGDEIIASLGTGADALKAAKDFVAAEQNFNPFNQDVPTLCSDPTLPTTEALRGIVPLIDPAVDGADAANALSAQSLTAPLDNAGLSIADILTANGFTNFNTKDAAGNAGAAAGGAAAGGAADAAADTGAAAGAGAADAGAANSSCNAGAAGAAGGADAAKADPTTMVTQVASATKAATKATADAAGSAANGAGNAGAANGTADAGAANGAGNAGAANGAADAGAAGDAAGAAAGGADFGTCDPTIRFEGGLGGRPATEFTFQSNDPAIEAVQQEALNPNIITNRVCDELTNQCGANQAAKDLCEQAQADVAALGTRDQTTADAFNSALGL